VTYGNCPVPLPVDVVVARVVVVIVLQIASSKSSLCQHILLYVCTTMLRYIYHGLSTCNAQKCTTWSYHLPETAAGLCKVQ